MCTRILSKFFPAGITSKQFVTQIPCRQHTLFFFDQVQWPCTRKVTVQGGDQQYLEATWCSLGADAITYDEVEDNMVAEVFPSLDRIPFQPPPTGVYALKLIPVFCRTKGRCKEREFSFNPRTSWHAGTRAGEHAVFSTLLIDVTARTQ